MSGKRRAEGPAVKKTPKQPGSTKRRLLKVLKWGLVVGVVLVLLAAGGFYWLYRSIDIPDPNADFETETTFVYYRGGKEELGSFAIQNRVPITYEEMPQHLKDAVVAAENRSFWTDSGIDPRGIFRALVNNASGESTQGASTITQQYVKILYLNQERSYTRKVKEAILALKLQRQQSKTEILKGYLNTIYFGRGAYGAQAAAQAYFEKDAEDLDLRESAALAAILNNPSGLDPDNGKRARAELRERYDYTLDGMADMGTIDPEDAERAQRKLPDFPDVEAESTYGDQKGHMLKLVRDELLRLGYSEDQIDGGGLRVETTFDPQVMRAAEQGVRQIRPDGFSDKKLHIGVASVEPGTGALRGFYGGQDYLDSQINWAEAGGQAGSTLKAFAVAAALKQGFSLNDTFDGNSPYVLPDGSDFENQGFESYGAVSLLTATENSINTAFIDLTTQMPDGPQKILETMNAMGIPPQKERGKDDPGFPSTSPGLRPQLGIALGSATVSPMNMANGYATIAAGGLYAEPYVIEKVTLPNGTVDYRHKVQTERVISEDIAADTSFALESVVTSGTGTAALELQRPAAGKTGTATNGLGEVSSAWFTGFTPQLATSVMYVRGKGNEQLQDWLPSYFGGDYPADTWTAVMRVALEGEPVEQLADPAYVDGDAPDTYTPTYDPTTAPPSSSEPTKETSPTKSEEPSDTPTDEPTTKGPTKTPTSQPPTSQPPTSDPPTSEPTSEPPTTTLSPLERRRERRRP